MSDYRCVDGFDERVRAKLAAKFPELVFRASAPGTIDVLPRGGREPVAQIGLASLARRVLEQPAKEDELVGEHVARLPFSQLVESLRGVGVPPVERIFPRLVPKSRIDALPPHQKPVEQDFHGTVRVVLVADLPQGDLYLTQRDLDELKLRFVDAIPVALSNLEKYLKAGSMRAAPGVAILDGHKHAAASILLPEFPRSLASQLGDEFYACVPACDQLIAFAKEPPELVKNMVATAKRAFEISEFPVTPQVFRVDPESVTPVTPGEESKLWLPGN